VRTLVTNSQSLPEMGLFFQKSCQIAEEQISKMNPKQLLGSFDMLQDAEMRWRLMQSSIKALKEQWLDIKQFNVVQICELI
jgi:hypothetical protein